MYSYRTALGLKEESLSSSGIWIGRVQSATAWGPSIAPCCM